MAERKYRKHTRLKNYDYNKPGYYFVTVCTRDRSELFSLRLSERYGKLLPSNLMRRLGVVGDKEMTVEVEKELLDLPQRFPVDIDFYIFVPSHVHFILQILECSCTACPCPDGDHAERGDHKARSYTLGDIVGTFKSLSTRRFWETGGEGKLFQPNYYEHVIRNETALGNIRHYILEHPYREFSSIEWEVIENI